MKTREPEPLEQIDYGIGYKASHSPQQHTSVKVEADRAYAVIAMILSFCSIVVIFLAGVMLESYIKAEAERSAARSVAKAEYAERDARVALDKLTYLQVELAKRGIVISYDEH